MRRGLAALALAGGLTCVSAVAAADPSAPQKPTAFMPIRPAELAADLAFYPPAAKAAGVEGQAVINCRRDEHLALRDCSLVSETPAGRGFGAAALAMAAKSPENTLVTTDDAQLRAPASLTVAFSLHPPQVLPDLTQPAHMVTKPTLVSGPTTAQIQAAYPVRALSDQVEGAALIDCTVGKTGKLSNCQVAAETPAGYGFGQAALDVSSDFTLKPQTVDGEAVEGAQVRVPVAFAHDPEAPLTLQTTPPSK